MTSSCSTTCVLSTISIFASALAAQVTPIQSSAQSDTSINISQSEFSDHPVAMADQLATNTTLFAVATASMDNEHGVFSGQTVTRIDFNGESSGVADVSLTFQGSEAGGAPIAGGFGHNLAGEFLYDFSLDEEADVQFDGVLVNSNTVFEAFVTLTIGGFSQSGTFQGNVFQQSILDTADLGTVPFSISATLPATNGHYQLSIKLSHSGLGLRDQPVVNSSMNTTFIINATAACPADLNGDGNLNFIDVSAFLTAFGNQDPIADFSGEGEFNFIDVSAFLTAFGNGCP